MAASATDKARKSYSYLQKTLNSSISDVDSALTPNNVNNIPTDTGVSFVVDRVDASGNKTPSLRELMTGVVSGSTIASLARGQQGTTAQAHSANAVIEFVNSGQMWNDLIDFLLQDHSNPSGHHKTLTDDNNNEWLERNSVASAVNQVKVSNSATLNDLDIAANGDDTNISMSLTPKGTGQFYFKKRFDGWTTGLATPNTITNNGNRSYSLVFNSTDLTSFLTAGMRLRVGRTAAAPTKCTSLNGSTQYYTKSSPAGLTATDNITVMGWIKPTVYQAGIIAARKNGTTDGWYCSMNASGQIVIQGARAGDDIVTTVQSVKLNKWTHIVITINSAGTAGTAYFDGASVPITFTNNANSGFLTPTGSLSIGADSAGGSPFAGKLAQVAIFNAVIAQATIQGYMSQTLAGTETNLVSAYSFNNSINDLNANANNLTAQGSAVATNADSPFSQDINGTPGSYDYGIITACTFSTNTTMVVQVPEGCAIPTTGGVSTLDYSATRTPVSFPAAPGRWIVDLLVLSQQATSGTTINTTYNPGGLFINLPIGAWDVTTNFEAEVTTNASITDVYACLSSSSSAIDTGSIFNSRFTLNTSSGTGANIFTFTKRGDITVSAATSYYILMRSGGAFTAMQIRGDTSANVGEATYIRAACAYL